MFKEKENRKYGNKRRKKKIYYNKKNIKWSHNSEIINNKNNKNKIKT